MEELHAGMNGGCVGNSKILEWNLDKEAAVEKEACLTKCVMSEA